MSQPPYGPPQGTPYPSSDPFGEQPPYGPPNPYPTPGQTPQSGAFGQRPPYGQPDPFGQPDPYGGPDPYAQPSGFGQPGFPGQFGQPQDPWGKAPKKSNRNLIVAIVAVVVLVGAGIGTWLVLDSTSESSSTSASESSGQAGDTASAGDTAGDGANDTGSNDTGSGDTGSVDEGDGSGAAAAVDAAQAYYSAVAAKDVDAAYANSCADLAASVSEFETNFFMDYVNYAGGLSTWDDLSESGQADSETGKAGSVVTASLTFADGTVEEDSNVYVSEGGSWKFCGYNN